MGNRKANFGSLVPFTEGEYCWTIVPVRGSIGGPSSGDEQGRLRACLGPWEQGREVGVKSLSPPWSVPSRVLSGRRIRWWRIDTGGPEPRHVCPYASAAKACPPARSLQEVQVCNYSSAKWMLVLFRVCHPGGVRQPPESGKGPKAGVGGEGLTVQTGEGSGQLRRETVGEEQLERVNQTRR